MFEVYYYYYYYFTSFAGETGLRSSGTFLQRRLPPNIPFPCKRFNQRSGAVPDNVHQLRPGDIDVVAAIGDSLTAGTGANAITLFESSVDNRGLSYSIGGWFIFPKINQFEKMEISGKSNLN